MGALYADRVQETTTTVGTGTVTVAGAVAGFRTFASAFAVGDRVRYQINDGTNWETGDGVLVTSTTITRENVYASSNAAALVNFGVGTKNVWCDVPASSIADMGIVLAMRAGMISR